MNEDEESYVHWCVYLVLIQPQRKKLNLLILKGALTYCVSFLIIQYMCAPLGWCLHVMSCTALRDRNHEDIDFILCDG